MPERWLPAPSRGARQPQREAAGDERAAGDGGAGRDVGVRAGGATRGEADGVAPLCALQWLEESSYLDLAASVNARPTPREMAPAPAAVTAEPVLPPGAVCRRSSRRL